MRVIEKKMVEAVKNGKSMGGSNTAVVMENGVAKVYLFGILIAKVTNDNIEITNCGGWRSYTTKGRLNALLEGLNVGTYIYQKDWCWYYSDKKEFEPRTFKLAA